MAYPSYRSPYPTPTRPGTAAPGPQSQSQSNYRAPGLSTPKPPAPPPPPTTPWQIPNNSQQPSPFTGMTDKGDVNFQNILNALNQYWGNAQNTRSSYIDAANAGWNEHMNGPLAQQMMSGLTQAFQPVVSPDQLSAMQSAGRDRVATEGATLQSALRAQLAGQGQLASAANPALIGAAYNTAYQTGQSDINQQFQASQMNQQGLQAALGAGNQYYGQQGQDLNAFNDLMQKFAAGDMDAINQLLALLGAKMA